MTKQSVANTRRVTSTKMGSAATAVPTALESRVRQLSDQVTEFRRVLQLVRNLHKVETVKGKATCVHCGVEAPCPTLTALKGRRS